MPVRTKLLQPTDNIIQPNPGTTPAASRKGLIKGERAKIKVVQKTSEGDTYMNVSLLYKVGTLVVHQATAPNSGCYSVSHAPTGLHVCTQRTRADAVKMADELWKRFYMAFREKDRLEVKIRLPNWVESWVSVCSDSQTWVDPLPFQEKGKQVSYKETRI